MTKFEQAPAQKEGFSVEDIKAIEDMPEVTVPEIQKKKQAFNNLILSLDGQINMVHADSGSNSPDDNSQEEDQNSQDLSLIRNSMDRARSEMVRLGDKEELELKKTA